MKLKVILAKDTPNKINLPPEWPVECTQVDDNYPDAWTFEYYENYRLEHYSKYASWVEAKKQVIEADIAKKKNQHNQKKEALKQKLSLTDEEFEILSGEK